MLVAVPMGSRGWVAPRGCAIVLARGGGLLWQMLPAWERALAFVSTEDFLLCSALVLILMKY